MRRAELSKPQTEYDAWTGSFCWGGRGELVCSPLPWQVDIVRVMPRQRSNKPATSIAFLAADSEPARRALKRLSKRYSQAAPDKADVIVALGGDGMMLETL